jgi:hypothetical protein
MVQTSCHSNCCVLAAKKSYPVLFPEVLKTVHTIVLAPTCFDSTAGMGHRVIQQNILCLTFHGFSFCFIHMTKIMFRIRRHIPALDKSATQSEAESFIGLELNLMQKVSLSTITHSVMRYVHNSPCSFPQSLQPSQPTASTHQPYPHTHSPVYQFPSSQYTPSHNPFRSKTVLSQFSHKKRCPPTPPRNLHNPYKLIAPQLYPTFPHKHPTVPPCT